MATPQEEGYLIRARQIKTETAQEANTAPRVGGLLEEALAYIFNVINSVTPGSTTPQYVSVYSAEVKYAFNINNPRAVLWPNAANQIRLWALKPTAAPDLKFRNAPSYQANSEWFDLGTTDIPVNPGNPDLSNYYDKTEINNLLAALARAGFQFYQTDFIAGTTTYSVPTYITATTLKYVDFLAGNNLVWDADKTIDDEAHEITLTAIPAVITNNGTLRVWFLSNENGNGANNFDIDAWLKAQNNYKPGIVQTFGHTEDGQWTFFDGGTTPEPTPLAAPTNFTATAVSSSRIDLSITAVPNATGYVYQRATDSNFSNAQTIYSGPSTTVQNVSGLNPSTQYFYRVYATATGYGNSGYALANATTLANTPTNVAPTANAGADQTITLPTNQVTLSGSGSDSDGSIASYTWTKISGSGTIATPNAATTNITGLTEGTSVFRLTVTDNGGLTATDDVTITVNPVATIPPAAAGTIDMNDELNIYTYTPPAGESTNPSDYEADIILS